MSALAKLEAAQLRRQIHGVVLVRTREVYGEPRVYPANTQAELLARIAGTTTLTRRVLELAQDMGFEIKLSLPAGTMHVHNVGTLF